MIVRIWRTHIDQARAGEYRDFAHSSMVRAINVAPTSKHSATYTTMPASITAPGP